MVLRKWPYAFVALFISAIICIGVGSSRSVDAGTGFFATGFAPKSTIDGGVITSTPAYPFGTWVAPTAGGASAAGVITLEQYGALGNGSTSATVDQAAWNSAVAALAGATTVGTGPNTIALGSNPVSYTHLDVYKRQD